MGNAFGEFGILPETEKKKQTDVNFNNDMSTPRKGGVFGEKGISATGYDQKLPSFLNVDVPNAPDKGRKSSEG